MQRVIEFSGQTFTDKGRTYEITVTDETTEIYLTSDSGGPQLGDYIQAMLFISTLRGDNNSSVQALSNFICPEHRQYYFFTVSTTLCLPPSTNPEIKFDRLWYSPTTTYYYYKKLKPDCILVGPIPMVSGGETDYDGDWSGFRLKDGVHIYFRNADFPNLRVLCFTTPDK